MPSFNQSSKKKEAIRQNTSQLPEIHCNITALQNTRQLDIYVFPSQEGVING
jgi:hypothetical protein